MRSKCIVLILLAISIVLNSCATKDKNRIIKENEEPKTEKIEEKEPFDKNEPNEFDIALDYLSQKLLENYNKYKKTEQKKKIAVASFSNQNGERSELGKIISDKIHTNIFNPEIFKLLERDKIDNIINEQKFNRNGLVSETEIKEFGKLSGADIILVGSIIPLNDSFNILCRLIDLISGEIIAVAEVKMKTDDLLYDYYTNIIQQPIPIISGAYSLKLGNLKLIERKYDALSLTNKPDIKLYIYQNDKEILSLIGEYNSFEFQINKNIDIVLIEGDIFRIEVFDQDILKSDKTAEIILTETKLKELINGEMKPISTEYIEEFQIELIKIKETSD